MKLLQNLPVKSGRVLACLGLGLAAVLLAGGLLSRGTAQDKPSTPEKKEAPAQSAKGAASAPATNAPAPAPAAAPSAENTADGTPAGPAAPAAQPAPAGTNASAPAKAEADKSVASDEVQLSLMGANVDMVVQWLAQNTGKTVIKSPKVQCQLMITSSKKLSKRAAITLVYRALALEGFSVTESSNAIYITPEGQEPEMNPELVDTASKDIPEGRQRLVKIFTLRHIHPAELKEKVRAVLSHKGVIECDDLAKQVIVTDYNENLRFLGELIKEFDVDASDTVIHIYPLKHSDAEEVGNLIGLILNAASSASASGGRAPSGSGGGGPSSSPGGPSGGPGGESPGGMMAGLPGGMPGGRPSPGGSSSSAPAGPGIGNQVTVPQVRIWPDRVANRLIVSAAKSRLPEVERLVEILDAEKPADVCVRVIPLKNVTAVDLVKEIGPLYQKLTGNTRKDIVEVGANDRSNSLIVLSSEANFKIIEKLVTSLDTEDAQEKVVRTFVLKNADAEDVAKQLQTLNQDQNSSRYPYYYFRSSMSEESHKKPSVVADRRRNSLVIQAPPNQMDSIATMIHELDEPITDDSLAPRIFHLKYASAVDIEDVLNELFLKKTQQRSYFYFFDEEQEPQADRNVGRLYGKVRITSEPYSNSLIITSNSKENLAVVEDVIKQLDAPSEQGESTLRIGLKFAKASIVANSINILFAKNGSPPLRQVNQQGQPNQPNNQPSQQQSSSQQGLSYLTGFDIQQEAKEEGYYPWIGGQPDNVRGSEGRSATRPVSDLVGRVRAVADPRSNALLISANVHFFPQILKLIEELDAATDQVLIEARLVEVSTDYLDRLGVRWSPNGSQVFSGDDFDNSIAAHGSGEYMKGFGGATSLNTPLSSGGSVLQQLTSLRSGVLDGTVNMDFLIQFMRRTTDAKVLASPQINIRDNETGRLFVGQQVPVPSQSTFSGIGSQNTVFVYKPVGVVLEVTPHINSNGDVELQIHAESSTIVSGLTVLGGDVFNTRAFRTDLTAKKGQTLVLGGIIQKQITDILRKTPILGDIPGLGYLFKKKDKEVMDDELMVFMRPRVTRTAVESKDLLDETYRKSPTVQDWDKENQPQPPKPGKRKP
jgi:general secretion pathway protein D